MSLTASMWTSVSGLLTHGEKMNVIGNNIANVNTVGFKGSRMDFADFVHQDVGTLSGTSQVGRGVTIGAIYGDFSQGAFESSTESTDIAISGNGFYRVVPKGTNDAYYTRAGNFRFDAEGYLVDPSGNVLQGWEIEMPTPSLATTAVLAPAASGSRIKGTGVPKDVRLATFSCEPHHTSNITEAINLDSAPGNDKTIDKTNPFAAMFGKWDTAPDPVSGKLEKLPIGQDSYAYQQSITVYDEGGTAHVLTIYFDQVTDERDPAGVAANDPQPIDNMDNGKRYWEYMVTMDPESDYRTFGANGADPVNQAKRGIIMAGTLTFDTGGQLVDQSAFVPTSGANMGNLSTWIQAPISSNGYPMFAPNFTGRDNASQIWDGGNPVNGVNPNTLGHLIELDLGLRNKSNTWQNPVANMSAIGNDAAEIPGFGTSAERQATTSTSFAGKGTLFYERFAKQDGYTFGELRTIAVDQDGVLSGRYSNGVTLELYQITLYDFPSKTNLRREGSNLYTQTRESGDPSSGAAGSGSFGAIYSNSIEQSNVDLAREFVQMITTQRGFQANSKSVTTVDTMLDTVINMKR